MNRKVMLISLFVAVLESTAALGESNQLLGTWKLKSFVREVAATGERYNQMGEHPDGYLTYAVRANARAFRFGRSTPSARRTDR